VTKWEYLFLIITGHNKSLYEADNMLVTTSDGRWRQEKMPKNVFGVVRQVGEEGWEMVQCNAGSGGNGGVFVWPEHYSFEAVFKRAR
jgi:hypothetical protein